jgi:hypothetical protein
MLFMVITHISKISANKRRTTTLNKNWKTDERFAALTQVRGTYRASSESIINQSLLNTGYLLAVMG